MREQHRKQPTESASKPAIETLRAVDTSTLSRAFHTHAIRAITTAVLQNQIKEEDWVGVFRLADSAKKAGMHFDLSPQIPAIQKTLRQYAEEEGGQQDFFTAKLALPLGISVDHAAIQSEIDATIALSDWDGLSSLLSKAAPFLPKETIASYQPILQHGLDKMMENLDYGKVLHMSIFLLDAKKAGIPLNTSAYNDTLMQKMSEYLENNPEKMSAYMLVQPIRYFIISGVITDVNPILKLVKDEFLYSHAYGELLSAVKESDTAHYDTSLVKKDLEEILELQRPYPDLFFRTCEKAAALGLIDPQKYKNTIEAEIKKDSRGESPMQYSVRLDDADKIGIISDPSIYREDAEAKLYQQFLLSGKPGSTTYFLERILRIGVFDLSPEFEPKLDQLLTNIPQDKLPFAAVYGADIARHGKPLTDIEEQGMETLKTIIDYSLEKNKLLEPDKQTKDVQEFWQKNQVRLAKMLGIHETFAQEYIKMTITQFGFPRLELALELLDRLDDSARDALSHLMQHTKHADQAFLGKLVELADAYERLDSLDAFKTATARLEGTTKQKVTDTLAPQLLSLLAKDLDISEKITAQSLEQWDTYNLSKLLVGERQFTPRAKELFTLIFASTLRGDFQNIIHDKPIQNLRLYEPQQIKLISEIQTHNRHVAKSLEKEGIDYTVWLNDKTTRKFTATETYEQNTEKRLQDFREKLFTQFRLLLENTQDPQKGEIQALLAPERAKRFRQSVFKKLGYEFKDGSLIQDGKEFFGLPDDIAKQAIVFLRDEIVSSKKQTSQPQQQNIQISIGNMPVSLIHPGSPEQRHMDALGKLQDVQATIKELVQFSMPTAAKHMKQRSFSMEVKLWDRQPGKDLFQGNYTQCCVAVDSDEKFKIGDYLVNTGIQIIEVVDKNTNLPIAQTYVYFIKNRDGETSMVLDNIEINRGYLGAQRDIGRNLVEYAKEFAERLTKQSGKPIKNILLGKRYNGDVVTKQIPMTTQYISEILGGNGVFGSSYVDSIGPGWVDFTAPAKEAFFVLKGETPSRRLPFESLPMAPTTRSSGTITHSMLADISKIERAAFTQELRDSDKDIEKTLKDKDTSYTLLMYGKEVIGYLFAEQGEESEMMYVSSMAIHPWFRNSAHFKQLMQSFYGVAKQKRAKKITMHVRQGGKLSKVLQKRFGAHHIKTEYNWQQTGLPYELLEFSPN